MHQKDQRHIKALTVVLPLSLVLSVLFYFILRPVSGESKETIVIKFALIGLFLGLPSFVLLKPRKSFFKLSKSLSLPKLGLLLFIIMGIAWMGSRMHPVQLEYPLWHGASHASPFKVALYEAAYFLYYFGWESFFRGFMLFGLLPLGSLTANLIQTLLSTLAHIGKPPGELWGALPFGFIMGWLALKTDSFIYPLFFHFLLGFFTDVLILYGK